MTSADQEKCLILASPRGYCAGVDRAIATVEKALQMFQPPVYVRHQIVHNKYVVDRLKNLGAVFVDDICEVPEGAVVIFSAHGVSPRVRAEAQQRHLRTIDATCPLVTKVHNEAVRFARNDVHILLIGHAGHEEVEGTRGEAPEHMTLVQSPAEAAQIELPSDTELAWLSQTTLSQDETQATVQVLRQRYPGLIDPPSDDICYATSNRQQAVKRIAALCDVVIVVGSANSSNSMRLVEVAKEHGAAHAYRVDDASEIDTSWLVGVNKVGVTSGASVPEELVRGVIDYLVAHGYPDVTEERVREESMSFALPPQVRTHRARQNPGETGVSK